MEVIERKDGRNIEQVSTSIFVRAYLFFECIKLNSQGIVNWQTVGHRLASHCLFNSGGGGNVVAMLTGTQVSQELLQHL